MAIYCLIPPLVIVGCDAPPTAPTQVVSITLAEEMPNGFSWSARSNVPVYFMHRIVTGDFKSLPIDKGGVWNWDESPYTSYSFAVESRTKNSDECHYSMEIVGQHAGSYSGQVLPSLGKLSHTQNLATRVRVPVDVPTPICVWTYEDQNGKSMRILYALFTTEKIPY